MFNPLKSLKIVALMSLHFFFGQEIKAQNIDTLSCLKINTAEIGDFSWTDIWFTENDINKEDSLIIKSEYFSKGKTYTLVASSNLKKAFSVWKIYLDTTINLSVIGKAYLKCPNGEILYDCEVDFKGNKINSKLNQNLKKETLLLFEYCNLWIESVKSNGYASTITKGLTPIPNGFTWIEF